MPLSYEDSGGTGSHPSTWNNFVSTEVTYATWERWTTGTNAYVDDSWEQWITGQGYTVNPEWDRYNSPEIRVPKANMNYVWVTWATDGTNNITPPEITHSVEVWQRWTVVDGQGTYHYAYKKKEEPKPTEMLSVEEVRRCAEELRRVEEVGRREREEAAKRAKEAEEARKLAEAKSLQLLLENLEANQKEIFERTGAIPVRGSCGGRYSIRKGISGNVDELNDVFEIKGIRARLCFHPVDYNIPVYDVMLAQKLMLENCEEDARKIANITEVRN